MKLKRLQQLFLLIMDLQHQFLDHMKKIGFGQWINWNYYFGVMTNNITSWIQRISEDLLSDKSPKIVQDLIQNFQYKRLKDIWANT